MPIKAPSVSIIITNYNYEQYITDAIQSVANQDYQNFECIVVDDASTDNSFEVIAEYLNKLGDARFRCLRLGKNSGQMAAFKVGLENTTGQFVGFLDADDLYFPDFITKHIEAHLNRSFSAGFTGCDTIQISENSEIFESTFHTLFKENRGTNTIEHVQPIPESNAVKLTDRNPPIAAEEKTQLAFVHRDFDGWHWSATSSIMFRRDLLELIFPDQPQNIRLCADYYLMLYCQKLTGSVTISTAHAAYRLHRKNGFANNARVGGTYRTGFFSDENRIPIEYEIARNCIKNFNQLSEVFGIDALARIVLKYIPEHRIYRETKSAKPLWQHISRRPRQWFDYAIGAPTVGFILRK
jgi:glycosyltransferase involved in cell wall biosynthesis